MSFIIELYETDSGKCPVMEFAQSTNPKLAAELLRDIDILANFGNQLREPYTKYLEDGILELRTQFGKSRCRSLYFFYANKEIIITNAFIKKTQKTPKDEIDKAKKYRKDWLERKKNEIRRLQKKSTGKSTDKKRIRRPRAGVSNRQRNN